MRLLSYQAEDSLRPGIVIDGEVFDIAELTSEADGTQNGSPARGSMREVLEAHGEDLPGLAAALEAAASGTHAGPVGTPSDLRLGPPVPDPSKVLCVGINYRDHAAETGRALPEYPDIFCKFSTSLVGPTSDLPLSEVSSKLDYEGELAVVIGRTCRRAKPEEALEMVAGAMILDDITARDLQFNATQWLPGKAVDGSTPCGPELVTLDELGDPQDLALATRVNGVEVQQSSTSRMIFTVAQIVSYISRFLTLQPGDLITTGTPDGVGSRMDPPSWLAPGDVVEVEIDGLGVLRNTVR